MKYFSPETLKSVTPGYHFKTAEELASFGMDFFHTATFTDNWDTRAIVRVDLLNFPETGVYVLTFPVQPLSVLEEIMKKGTDIFNCLPELRRGASWLYNAGIQGPENPIWLATNGEKRTLDAWILTKSYIPADLKERVDLLRQEEKLRKMSGEGPPKEPYGMSLDAALALLLGATESFSGIYYPWPESPPGICVNLGYTDSTHDVLALASTRFGDCFYTSEKEAKAHYHWLITYRKDI